MIVAGYILAIHQHLTEEQHRLTPGNTPIRRRGNTQTQTTPAVTEGSTTPALVEYSQHLIQDDMCQQMFALVLCCTLFFFQN